ncbi:CD5 antigen-like [Nyctibius grandis]|uniref:CD5 antigen-like n=1 Tax=Nyctibius grandis TaxID=48427 RepID=UPI0035BC89B4
MGPVSVFEGAVEVRLEDGSGRCAGRVEVKHQGQWGTVCDDYWGMDDAAVVCKQLDCGSAVEAHLQGYFGRGSGPIWLDDVGCNGTESALSDCTHRGWGEHNCVDGEEAGVTCSGFVWLVEGKSRCLGRVKIRDGDQWKSVCASHFGPKAADVVCRELQCGTALPIPGAAHFGEGVSPTWDGELQCVGNESLLASCPRGPPRDQPCTHANSAVVICTLFEGAAEVRLADDGKRAERVEVKQQGKWGTVCGDYWDMHNAAVVCKQLGCGSAVGAPQYRHFGPGSGPIWMNEGGCNSTESALSDCTHRGWGENSCNHASDTRVMCSGSYSEGSLSQLQPYPGYSEEEDGLGSAAGDDPVDGYDDAREVSDPGEDAAPGQREWEMTRVPEEGAGPKDAPGGGRIDSPAEVYLSIYTNAHSMGNKQEELEAIVQQENYDLLAIREIWWDDSQSAGSSGSGDSSGSGGSD